MQQRTLSRAKEKERERETKEEGDQKRGRWRTRWTPLQFIAYALTTCLQAFLSFPHLCGFRLSCKQTKKSPSALLPHTVRQTVSLSLSVQLPVSSPVPPFSNRNKCGLANRRGTAIFAAQAANASMVSQGPHALHWRPNELFWFNLSNRTEQNRTEHWATIWPPLGHRRSRHRSCNARKVNIYVGQGAHCKWGFIQCAETNYCANTSDEFCT